MNIPYTIEERPDTGLANGKLGIWLFLASEVMLFGALFSTYIILRMGAPVGRNPWDATTLEWSAPSPPGHGNFEAEPVVYRGPYEYSVPGAQKDFTPQFEPEDGKRR